MFSFQKRIEFIKEAIAGNPSFLVWENDFRESDKSYTIYLIDELKALYPNYNFSFVIGADNITKLKTWYKYKELMSLIDFIVIDRDTDDKKDWQALDYYHKLRLLSTPLINVSSSEIRQKILNGEDVSQKIAFKVERLSQ